MSEAHVIAATPGLPPTVESLAADLARLGVASGATLLVHASLSSLGWVVGDAPAVIEALSRALGPRGTLMMPTHTGQLRNPATWNAPAVPIGWLQTINSNVPAFDPAITPTRIMGAIAESFRTHPGVLRSRHPHVSFAARGPQAHFLIDDHSYDNGMGESSPLARLYDCDGWVLLLGVGHNRNTSLHLSEHRCSWPGKTMADTTAPLLVDGRRRLATIRDISFDDSDFADIGSAYEHETQAVRLGKIGNADTRLMRQRPLVDFGARWIAAHRRWS